MRKRHFIVFIFALMLLMAAADYNAYAASKYKINRIAIEAPNKNVLITDNDRIDVKGYFLTRKTIKEAKVYLDGTFTGEAKTGIIRKDIVKKYHKYRINIKAGYSCSIDTLNMDKGKHKITVVGVTSDNKTLTTSRSFIYKGQAPKLKIESPKENFDTENYSVTISGYAMSTSETKEIDVLLDGIYWECATKDIDRQDMAAKYPEYKDAAKSGFKYALDLSSQQKGKHTITIEVYSSDGKKYSKTIDVMYNKPSPKLKIKAPKSGRSVNDNNLDVTGWSVGASGIDNVEVFLDGKCKGKANTGIVTADTSDIVDKYKGAKNAGYSLKFDITTLPIGKHTLEVRSTDMDGVISYKQITFNMNGAVDYMRYADKLNTYVDAQYARKSNFTGNSKIEAGKHKLYEAMNPDTYVSDPQGRFMFLKLDYTAGIHASDLDTALKGMGILEGHGSAFIKAGKKYNINPIYLVAHALHETDRGTSKLGNGVDVSSVGKKPVETKKVYNMYGIGAVDAQPDKAGAERAYKEGWYSVEDAIIGGARFISTSYIKNDTYKQYTLYRMKWYFNKTTGAPVHEYATDIYWAYSQTKYIKSIVDKMSNPVLVFEVPKFSE